MAAKRALVVLGMHRSGTSSVAGALTLLGAAAPKTLMAAAVDNPKGFFESRLVGELNDRILQAAGSRWDDWRRFDASALAPDTAHDFRDQIRATLHHEFGSDPLVVLKDPRLCRMLPIWGGVFEEEGYEADFVLPVRSPLEVARSLNRRNGMPIAAGVLLWLRHVLDGEKLTRSKPRRILLWRTFMEDWRSEVAAIQEALHWDADVTDERARDVDGFLSVDLQHEVVSDDALGADPDAHAWALEVYEALAGLSAGKDDSAHLATLDRVAASFDEACKLYGAVHQSLVLRVEELEAELAHQTVSSDSLLCEALDNHYGQLTRKERIERALAMTASSAVMRNEARAAFSVALRHSESHLSRVHRAQQSYAGARNA